MNGAPGMRTRGSFDDVAQPSRICQWTRNGVANTSRKKPGTIAVNACGWGTMSRNSISRTSPGRAPLTKTGPVSGWMAPASIHGDDGLNVRMKPVVAGRWLISQALAAVDLDGLHGLSSCRLRSHHGRHVPARLRHPRKRPVGLRRLPD